MFREENFKQVTEDFDLCGMVFVPKVLLPTMTKLSHLERNLLEIYISAMYDYWYDFKVSHILINTDYFDEKVNEVYVRNVDYEIIIDCLRKYCIDGKPFFKTCKYEFEDVIELEINEEFIDLFKDEENCIEYDLSESLYWDPKTYYNIIKNIQDGWYRVGF